MTFQNVGTESIRNTCVGSYVSDFVTELHKQYKDQVSNSIISVSGDAGVSVKGDGLPKSDLLELAERCPGTNTAAPTFRLLCLLIWRTSSSDFVIFGAAAVVFDDSG